ncbi:VOC family protein [Roseomonas sp. E05]|uniref:VOC family protein n=1 Tax=Roseomonas sp. E05 TaxID=3046310 RepID=UPI0024BB95F8|nr:VOC family protein [Roseomonas sp. E05]MDJ0386783.1 VOC family protein [Roseomonas sp. E05]
MPNPHGVFIWYELMTTDAPAATAFYRAVLGWGARSAGQPGTDYTLLLAGDAPVAGAMTMPQDGSCAGEGRPTWIGDIAVEDVDAMAARVTEAGGSILRPPEDIPGIGRFAVAADPEGTVFVLFRGTEAMPLPPFAMDKPGHPAWHELVATDAEAAFAFYSRLFGWTKAEAHDMGPMGVYQLFAADGVVIGGMMTRPPGMAAFPWTFYFRLESVGAAAERLQAQGGTVLNGPHEVPGGQWILQARDPQGASFALISAGR